MKWIACIAFVVIVGCAAEQNKAFRERAEIYSSNVLILLFTNIKFHSSIHTELNSILLL